MTGLHHISQITQYHLKARLYGIISLVVKPIKKLKGNIRVK